jgi:hypothetical protein
MVNINNSLNEGLDKGVESKLKQQSVKALESDLVNDKQLNEKIDQMLSFLNKAGEADTTTDNDSMTRGMRLQANKTEALNKGDTEFKQLLDTSSGPFKQLGSVLEMFAEDIYGKGTSVAAMAKKRFFNVVAADLAKALEPKLKQHKLAATNELKSLDTARQKEIQEFMDTQLSDPQIVKGEKDFNLTVNSHRITGKLGTHEEYVDLITEIQTAIGGSPTPTLDGLRTEMEQIALLTEMKADLESPDGKFRFSPEEIMTDTQKRACYQVENGTVYDFTISKITGIAKIDKGNPIKIAEMIQVYEDYRNGKLDFAGAQNKELEKHLRDQCEQSIFQNDLYTDVIEPAVTAADEDSIKAMGYMAQQEKFLEVLETGLNSFAGSSDDKNLVLEQVKTYYKVEDFKDMAEQLSEAYAYKIPLPNEESIKEEKASALEKFFKGAGSADDYMQYQKLDLYKKLKKKYVDNPNVDLKRDKDLDDFTNDLAEAVLESRLLVQQAKEAELARKNNKVKMATKVLKPLAIAGGLFMAPAILSGAYENLVGTSAMHGTEGLIGSGGTIIQDPTRMVELDGYKTSALGGAWNSITGLFSGTTSQALASGALSTAATATAVGYGLHRSKTLLEGAEQAGGTKAKLLAGGTLAGLAGLATGGMSWAGGIVGLGAAGYMINKAGWGSSGSAEKAQSKSSLAFDIKKHISKSIITSGTDKKTIFNKSLTHVSDTYFKAEADKATEKSGYGSALMDSMVKPFFKSRFAKVAVPTMIASSMLGVPALSLSLTMGGAGMLYKKMRGEKAKETVPMG